LSNLPHIVDPAANNTNVGDIRRKHKRAEFNMIYLTVCSGQLSLLPSAGREMSGSLRATGWRPSVADWGGGMSASCNRGSNCSLYRLQSYRFNDFTVLKEQHAKTNV